MAKIKLAGKKKTQLSDTLNNVAKPKEEVAEEKPKTTRKKKTEE